MNLDEIMLHGLKTAKTFIEDGDQAECVFFAETGDNEMVVLMAPLSKDEDEKTRTLGMIKLFFGAYDVKQYVQISECWMASVDDRTDPAVAKLMPRQRSDRREVLMAIGVERGKPAKSKTCPIERTPAGAKVLPPDDAMDGVTITGRMTELLAPPGVEMPAERKMAPKMKFGALGIQKSPMPQAPTVDSWGHA